jgi:hypothetical protein
LVHSFSVYPKKAESEWRYRVTRKSRPAIARYGK